MSQSLGEFQVAFVDALYGGQPSGIAGLTAQPGFQVYRNTVLKGASDALLANYPTIERLVGTEWFRAAAAVHIHQSPPTDARLIYYGEGFADFLDGFEPARELPYLGNVARLDRLWNAVHSAAEEPGIELAYFASLSPEELGRARLRPRQAVAWRWFADQPAYSLWRINREQREMPDELAWQAEGALLTRPTGRVEWQALDLAGCTFLDACAAGETLEQAAELAVQAQPSVDFMDLLGRLIAAGVFAASDGAPSR